MKEALTRILPRVQKPARYTGGEYGQTIKNNTEVDLRFCFCFPDVYEVGMSHLGLRILYGLINGIKGVWCERAFAPWPDMEAELRKSGLPLYGLESGDSLADFDILGFTLQYELSYTNVLTMLDLAGIPLRASDRGEDAPLVIAGGPCTANPEPLAMFFDLFVIGEGEEVTCEIIELYRSCRKNRENKAAFLEKAARLGGVYVPSLYGISYNDVGEVTTITPRNGAPDKITKRVIRDLDSVYFPENMIVPSTEIVHDRVVLELFRGCIRGCRFCQAGHTTRPVRYKSPETINRQAKLLCSYSGCEEMSLASLSTSDYPFLGLLCDELLDWSREKGVSLSLPSLRADSFSMELTKKISQVRKSGLTFAPEAGTQRLRDAINKNLTEEAVLSACEAAFSAGWSTVKLYFMLGLPTETDEDVLAIAEMAQHVLYTWRKSAKNKNRGVKITVSTSSFVPKPHTPFQWMPQNTMEELSRKIDLLRSAINSKSITYNWHEPRTSYLEAIFARGDRRLGEAIESAWLQGCRFDSWDEQCRFDTWLSVIRDKGLDPAFYANRRIGDEETLPWEHIDCGVTKKFLLKSLRDGLENKSAADCKTSCAGCGANLLVEGGPCDV